MKVLNEEQREAKRRRREEQQEELWRTGMRQVTVIPAQPGYNLVWSVADDDNEICDDLSRQPVIAWCVMVDMQSEDGKRPYYRRFDPGETPHIYVMPVTIEGQHEDENYAVEFPDGHFTIPLIWEGANKTELLAYWRDEKKTVTKSESKILAEQN